VTAGLSVGWPAYRNNMDAIAPKTNSPPRKRRWFQYTLRALLVLMLLASIGFSWLAVKLQQARRQQKAVEAIVRLGGQVEYDRSLEEGFLASVEVASFSGTRLSDGDLQHLMAQLEELARLRDLRLDGTQVSDAGAEHLQRLTQLRWLDLIGTQVTDVGLGHLKGLTHLELLSLNQTRIGDHGLEHLKGLTELWVLNLGDTQITDAGLEHLKGLKHLQYLDLAGTRVTAAGLGHLKALTQLKGVQFRRAQVTDEDVRRLQRALPNCKITISR